MTMSMATPATTAAAPKPGCCPGCGFDLPPPLPDKDTPLPPHELEAAQVRIKELEMQVRQLNERASAAVGRWADYEAELVKLRSMQPSNAASPTTTDPSPTRMSFLPASSSFTSLLYRKSTPNLRAAKPPAIRTLALSPSGLSEIPNTPATGTSMAEELLEALGREQSLRQEAEGRLSATSKEVEELSASLFEQANEMVADERRARAKLEERVDELERRDFDKRQRLDRLEKAMDRIERVKRILNDDNPTPQPSPTKLTVPK